MIGTIPIQIQQCIRDVSVNIQADLITLSLFNALKADWSISMKEDRTIKIFATLIGFQKITN